jgi:hypothetical protein
MDLEQVKAAIFKLYDLSGPSHLESDAVQFLPPCAQQKKCHH